MKCIRREKGEEYPALLFASDTQETGAYKTAVNKILQVNPKGLPAIFVAGTGTGSLIEEFADDLKEANEDFYAEERKSKKNSQVTRYTSLLLWSDRKRIGDLAREIHDRVESNPDLGFQCVIGTSDSLKKTEVLVVETNGTFRRGRDFEAIGTGAVTGRLLVAKRTLFPRHEHNASR